MMARCGGGIWEVWDGLRKHWQREIDSGGEIGAIENSTMDNFFVNQNDFNKRNYKKSSFIPDYSLTQMFISS